MPPAGRSSWSTWASPVQPDRGRCSQFGECPHRGVHAVDGRFLAMPACQPPHRVDGLAVGRREDRRVRRHPPGLGVGAHPGPGVQRAQIRLPRVGCRTPEQVRRHATRGPRRADRTAPGPRHSAGAHDVHPVDLQAGELGRLLPDHDQLQARVELAQGHARPQRGKPGGRPGADQEHGFHLATSRGATIELVTAWMAGRSCARRSKRAAWRRPAARSSGPARWMTRTARTNASVMSG